MGPVIICDKSTLQSLSRDELSMLRRFYSLNIPPILLVEILGDLKKSGDTATARREVGILADKLVPACCTVNTPFRRLIQVELAGNRFPRDGRPVLEGARHVESEDGRKGIIFKESAEARALLRWQAKEFNEVEEGLAEAWRLSTQMLDLDRMQRLLRCAYSPRLKLKSFAETAAFVDDLLSSARPQLLLEWFLNDVGLSTPLVPAATKKVKEAPTGSLPGMFPYTAHCVRTALMFHFALAFGLVSTRPTNRVDLEYLFYSPFCNAFSSGDTFHHQMAPLVIGTGTYVPRELLKGDLNGLALRWAKLSPEEQSKESRAQGPPENETSVTHQLWQKTMMPNYREIGGRHLSLPEETSAKLLQDYQTLIKKHGDAKTPFVGSMEDCDFVLMEHMVRPDGPCICGSAKIFRECCGREVVNSAKKKAD